MNDVRFSLKVPDGDDRERSTCDRCGYVAYQNPKIVVGAVATHEGKILMCRRAIEPRRGFWTLPAGYLELEETPEEGAVIWWGWLVDEAEGYWFVPCGCC